jgi:hypothetical protein
VRFAVECAYVLPDGSVKRVRKEREIAAGWTGSVHVQGIRLERWPVGRYRVSCWNNAEPMAAGSFEIVAGSRNQESGVSGPTLRFYARPGSYASTFTLGGYDSLYVEATASVRAAGDSTSFNCEMMDPAGITSAFALNGAVHEKALVASGPVGTLDPPKLRGSYRVQCRTGAKALVTDRFELSGPAELSAIDARLVSSALYSGGEQPPDDEATPDVVWSAAKLKSLWVMALLDHPSDQGLGSFAYSCRVSTAKNVVVATSGPATLAIEPGARALVLRQRIVPVAKTGRWVPGKYGLSCDAGAVTLLRVPFELTR